MAREIMKKLRDLPSEVHHIIQWRLSLLRHLIRRHPEYPTIAMETTDATETFLSIGRWISSASFDELDAEIVHQAKRVLLDGLVSMLAGIYSLEGQALIRQFNTTPSSGQCIVPGSRITLSSVQAAFLGSALCQIHDANDGHPTAGQRGSAYHPGRVVIPAALALAQEMRLSGKDLICALTVGYDIALGTTKGPLQSPADAYGAAAAAAYALGLDQRQTAFAVRVAGFMAPSSGAQDFETNNLTCAQQARSGVEATIFVKQGYPISAAYSLGIANFRFSPPEQRGAFMHELYFKPYPACRWTHYHVDAALALRPRVIDHLDTVTSLRIYVPKQWKGPAHKVGPGEYYKTYQFSTSYCTVAALVDGELGLRQFSPARTSDSFIQKLQTITCFIEMPVSGNTSTNNKLFGRLELELADGTIHSENVYFPLGSPENPLSNADIANKLRLWLGFSSSDAQRLEAEVMDLDNKSDLSCLMTCLRDLGKKRSINYSDLEAS